MEKVAFIGPEHPTVRQCKFAEIVGWKLAYVGGLTDQFDRDEVMEFAEGYEIIVVPKEEAVAGLFLFESGKTVGVFQGTSPDALQVFTHE